MKKYYLMLFVSLFFFGCDQGKLNEKNRDILTHNQIMKDKEIAFKLKQSREMGSLQKELQGAEHYQVRRLLEKEHKQEKALREKLYVFAKPVIQFLSVIGGCVGLGLFFTKKREEGNVHKHRISEEEKTRRNGQQVIVNMMSKKADKIIEKKLESGASAEEVAQAIKVLFVDIPEMDKRARLT